MAVALVSAGGTGSVRAVRYVLRLGGMTTSSKPYRACASAMPKATRGSIGRRQTIARCVLVDDLPPVAVQVHERAGRIVDVPGGWVGPARRRLGGIPEQPRPP